MGKHHGRDIDKKDCGSPCKDGGGRDLHGAAAVASLKKNSAAVSGTDNIIQLSLISAGESTERRRRQQQQDNAQEVPSVVLFDPSFLLVTENISGQGFAIPRSHISNLAIYGLYFKDGSCMQLLRWTSPQRTDYEYIMYVNPVRHAFFLRRENISLPSYRAHNTSTARRIQFINDYSSSCSVCEMHPTLVNKYNELMRLWAVQDAKIPIVPSETVEGAWTRASISRKRGRPRKEDAGSSSNHQLPSGLKAAAATASFAIEEWASAKEDGDSSSSSLVSRIPYVSAMVDSGSGQRGVWVSISNTMEPYPDRLFYVHDKEIRTLAE